MPCLLVSSRTAEQFVFNMETASYMCQWCWRLMVLQIMSFTLKKKCNSKTGAFEIKTFHKVQLKREPVAIYFWSEIVIQLLSFAVYLLNDYTQDTTEATKPTLQVWRIKKKSIVIWEWRLLLAEDGCQSWKIEKENEFSLLGVNGSAKRLTYQLELVVAMKKCKFIRVKNRTSWYQRFQLIKMRL